MNTSIRLLFLAVFIIAPASLFAEDLATSKIPSEQTAIQANLPVENTECGNIKSTENSSVDVNMVLALEETSVPTQYGCCKICRIGKACGDTCISRYKECHVGPGCACDE